MKLDPTDILILKELTEDGRASFRQIAKRASLSTPTVSSRLERMVHAGLIKKFVPIYDPEATANLGISAIVALSVPMSKVTQITKNLCLMPEVLGLFVTTGQSNLIAKVNLPNLQSLQSFLTSMTLKKLGVEVVGNQIITETVKDDHPMPFADSLQLRLKCDFCKGEISTSRPYTIKVAESRYYFCCKTCRKSYVDKHGQKIRQLNGRINA
jgi:DNA-binding Lrp family transcriptional regulator